MSYIPIPCHITTGFGGVHKTPSINNHKTQATNQTALIILIYMKFQYSHVPAWQVTPPPICAATRNRKYGTSQITVTLCWSNSNACCHRLTSHASCAATYDITTTPTVLMAHSEKFVTYHWICTITSSALTQKQIFEMAIVHKISILHITEYQLDIILLFLSYSTNKIVLLLN